MTSKLDPCRTEETEGWSVITSAEALPSQLFRDDGVSMEMKRRKTSFTHAKEIFLSCYRQTLFLYVLGMTLMRGWSIPAALHPSWCLRSGGDVTVQKVFSPGASTQAKVLRSACVFSVLLTSLLQRATWPASFISSAVSLGLQKEDLD